VTVDTDFLARYSDQVFASIVHSGDDNYVDERAEVYRKLIDEFVSESSIGEVDLRCSIGISRISEKSSVVDTILNNADKACVQAQRNGGNQVKRFQTASPAEDPVVLQKEESQEWKTRLQDALKNDDFRLHYQPIVSLHGKEQEIYEVLLRMLNEKGEILDAEAFINQATQFEQMIDIDQWVIAHAMQALAQHQLKFPKTKFFIKLSKQTLSNTGFIDWFKGILAQHNLNAGSLVFEISETQAMEDIQSAKGIVGSLKQIGCEFGLEHFGSGIEFSSILDSLDVDYLKINGAFVQNMSKDTENQAAVKAIIEMGKSANKFTIAEFVSDVNSLALLWRLGVDYAQGYYIHEPSENLDYNFEDDDL
jgi:EAL domain-containing protein (putative c-di-GMP-specific phosphodiesterase class I)